MKSFAMNFVLHRSVKVKGSSVEKIFFLIRSN